MHCLQNASMIKGILFAIMWASMCVSPALAGWQEGREAFDQGDSTTALKEFGPLAEQGSKEAQAMLGYIYSNGGKWGVQKNLQEAYKWYRLAAENGEAQAQVALGRMYWEGRDIPQDYREAMRLFELAAAQGASGGQTSLGIMYLNGNGVEKDYEAALKWFRLAAEQGDGLAQLQLGHMYYEGMGVPQDLVQAHVWFSFAATKGAKGAGFLRDYMAKSMTASQLSEARRRAREWDEKMNN
jgi:TPR repeat protein